MEAVGRIAVSHFEAVIQGLSVAPVQTNCPAMAEDARMMVSGNARNLGFMRSLGLGLDLAGVRGFEDGCPCHGAASYRVFAAIGVISRGFFQKCPPGINLNVRKCGLRTGKWRSMG